MHTGVSFSKSKLESVNNFNLHDADMNSICGTFFIIKYCVIIPCNVFIREARVLIWFSIIIISIGLEDDDDDAAASGEAPLQADSTKRKRRLKMKRHKHKKRMKAMRHRQ